MLQYNEMYDIAMGVNLAFKGKSKKALVRVNHKDTTRDKTKTMFPINKYSTFTRENFILLNLYINFSKNINSKHDVIKALVDLDIRPIKIDNIKKELGSTNIKDVYKFKRNFISHKVFFINDMKRIRNEETNIDIKYMLNEYRNKRIEWYTLYLFIRAKDIDINSIESRIDYLLLTKIKKLAMYLIVSEKSISKMKQLLDTGIKL